MHACDAVRVKALHVGIVRTLVEVDAFFTLPGETRAELEVRGSRFLAIAVPIGDRASAESFVAGQVRVQRNPTHVVPVWRLCDGTAWSSDAGEPAGSAGLPLVAALEGAGLHDVAAVVVRWYGGVNLGLGGLVRAYGGVLADALARGGTVERVRTLAVEVRFDHGQTASVLRVIDAHGGRDLAFAYDVAAECTFALPASQRAPFERALRDATRGRVTATVKSS